MTITTTTQNFGIEIELTGITRARAARIIAQHFGTDTQHRGGSYDTYTAKDAKNRTWKAMSDASIRTERMIGNSRVSASPNYSCEVVTPILQYEDLADVRAILGNLVKAGALANPSCGIHVHADGANHTPESLTRLEEFTVGRQDLFYEALGIGDRADRWCKKTSASLLKAMKDAPKTRDSLERVWYSDVNDGYCGGIDHAHYNYTRYHGINLHAFFTKGTVEFRLFNGTTDADKILSYVQFCLAVSAWAINAGDRMSYRDCSGYTAAQKERLMTSVLVNRLGMAGKEFKTARRILTEAFRGNAA
jgi:hypothetical protein